MIKQAFAKNYMPSGGGGNYKYYKINDPEILEFILENAKMPVIDIIDDGKLYSFVEARSISSNNFYKISALRTDNSYHYLVDISFITEKPDTYVSVTGDLIKILKIIMELVSTPKEQQDNLFSMFQEISKGEYEAMIKK